jgi:hypothetical protein
VKTGRAARGLPTFLAHHPSKEGRYLRRAPPYGWGPWVTRNEGVNGKKAKNLRVYWVQKAQLVVSCAFF